MNLKEIRFPIEIKSVNHARSYILQKAYTNDLDSIKIIFELLDCTPEDLTGATASIMLYMRDGSFFQDSATITGSNVTYILTEAQGNHAGVAQTQVIVKKTGTEWASSKEKFEIVAGLETVVATEVMIKDWTTLTAEARAFIDDAEALVAQVNDMTQRIDNLVTTPVPTGEIIAEEIIDARAGKVSLGQKIRSVDEQLAEIAIQIDESLVVNGDYTSAINDAIAKATTAAKIIFPTNKDMTISSSINFPSNTVVDFANAKLNVTGNFRPITVIGTAEIPKKNVHIKNLNITFNGTGKNQSALKFEYAEDCTYENIVIDNPGLNGVEIVNCKRVHGRNGTIKNPQSFGLFYYLSDECSDSNFYVHQPKSWGHQFKSSQHCKSFDISVLEPQNEYGLYMWSGYGDGVNAPRLNEHCGYIRPKVKGTATSKHLIYINASPNCYIENPILEQVSGGWSPISVAGRNTVDDGLGGSFTTDSSGCLIINPKIKCTGGTDGISFVGVSGYTIKNCKVIGGEIINPSKGINNIYAEGILIDGTVVKAGSIGVEASNSRVECLNVSVSDNSSNAFVSLNDSLLKLKGCESYRAGGVGINSASSSVVVVNGGIIEESKNSGLLINGTGGSYIGGGLKVIGARTEATSYQSAIRLLGSNVLIENVIFDVGASTKLDSFIKEEGSATNNRIGKNNIFIGSMSYPIMLLASSGTKGEDYGTSTPTAGTWTLGWIRLNASPSPGGYTGWICTTEGSPGTWKGFGLIEA